ncbi:M23 family metallopeptidase [Apibacter muscae]|uniref:M23 family metallopeptidase n=1 Tax=Apibacter muscae TaxID=2509004 RepID=A0A563D9G9_9FLAO|nr:M23 family metallopeptidase [Apibacter muscae]TWP26855.1 M23 family metallopeptidase [Apibacter muscae]
MKKIALITFFLSKLLISQDFPKDFRSPVQIPISLSGNFGELRNNHFHAGIDIRTQQRIGLKVLAPKYGYVSRIKISPYGYGKAVYIDHPNGYTTVYGHLSELKGDINTKAREEQYKKQNYSIDLYLKPNELPVTEGDLIALTGNTGGSGGPHLHFEVRDTKTEEILNPFLFGFDIADNVPPQINGTWIYPIDGIVNGSREKIMVSQGGNYFAAGKIGFGIKTYDKQNASNNLNGIYFIKTYVNGELISEYIANRHSFDESRAINATIDYKEKLNRNSWIYRTYLLPGNTLQMYEQTQNKGIVEIESGKNYSIKLVAGDFAGNTTTRSFTVQGIENISTSTKPAKGKYTAEILKPLEIKENGIHIKFDKGSFYENIDFDFQPLEINKFKIHNSSVPLHKAFELSIKPDWSTLDKNKAEHYVIFRQSNYGPAKKQYLPTIYKNGIFTASPKDLGEFSLVLDDIPPTITSPMLTKSKQVGKKLSFIIKDAESGIKSYDVWIDGKWILAEYEYKQNSLFIPDLSKEGIDKGFHEVEVRVMDEANNLKIYKNNFEKL